MTNDELQMMKEIRSSKVERRAGAQSAVSSFGFRWSFGFRDSHREGAAGILPAVLFSGRSAGKMPAALWGSWRASFRFFACIGTLNPPLTPPRRGTFAAESADHAAAFG